MKYTVVWKPDAEIDLATLWNAASDRNAVAAADNQIDYVLAHNPHGVGESRPGNRRLLIVRPLAVVYRVQDQDCLVTFGAVWQIGQAGT
jgi:plasmid stabilization system protein ParE